MTEGMRDYLLAKGIKKVYSSFGASDLELNISTENDFTISIRKLLRSNASLRQKVLKYTGALPMVFQFNPTDFLIESSETGELIITICRPDYLAPKIRYNIHDRGHVMQLNELELLLREMNIDLTGISKPLTDLPILFHYGRADMTVSFFGSNISPTDIQEALYNLPALVTAINSFCLNVVEDKDENLQLVVSFEMQKDKNQSEINLKVTQTDFYEQLAKTNQDFREAKRMAANDDLTIIRLYEFGQGPFADFDCRIKAKYIS